MCVCALLTWFRKEWISVRLFVYKWTHSGPKRRRSADLRVSMQPRQRSSRHKQLHNTTCLRTALKSPVKCSKWCELKKRKKKKIKKEAKSACHCGCLLFFKWVWRVFQSPADNHFDSHWHLPVGKAQVLSILFQDKDLFDLHLNCKMHFFFFFLRKERKRLEVCFVPNETDSSDISQVLNARCYSLPCHLHGEEHTTTHQSRKAASHSSLGAWNTLESLLTA